MEADTVEGEGSCKVELYDREPGASGEELEIQAEIVRRVGNGTEPVLGTNGIEKNTSRRQCKKWSIMQRRVGEAGGEGESADAKYP